MLALPLRRRSGEALGWACFLLDAAPPPAIVTAMQQLAQTWSYCWEMLAGRPRSGWRTRWRRLPARQRRLAVIALAALLLLPVRQSALAPAEVIAIDAEVVAAPLDGVIKTVHVRPNQTVKADQPLFSLDDTTLRNRLEVAQKSVAVADAELLSATQKAFDNVQSKADLALLGGRAHERRAELAAVRTMLARVDVVAPRDGVAVFGDPNEWLGRPVTTVSVGPDRDQTITCHPTGSASCRSRRPRASRGRADAKARPAGRPGRSFAPHRRGPRASRLRRRTPRPTAAGR